MRYSERSLLSLTGNEGYSDFPAEIYLIILCTREIGMSSAADAPTCND